MDPIVASYNRLHGLDSIVSPSCCEGSTQQPHKFEPLNELDTPQAQYARFVTPRLTTIESAPTRTKRRAVQLRHRASTNTIQAPRTDQPAPLRTFFQDEDESSNIHRSTQWQQLACTPQPIECFLDLEPSREDSSSPLTATSWSSERYSPWELQENAAVARIICHNNVRIADDEWWDQGAGHNDGISSGEDGAQGKQETLVFRSQDLLEVRLQANNEAVGKLDWCSVWMGRLDT